MKMLRDICNLNISNSLHSLLEASILSDIEDTLNTDITKDIFDKIFKSQSKDEFNTRVEFLKTILNTDIKKPSRKDIICNIRGTYDNSYYITLSRHNKVGIVTITYENNNVVKRFNRSVIMKLIPQDYLVKADASGILPKEIIVKDLI